ncbi:retrotransposon nucleocapsid protein [Gigaspora margarita]|uniref:Retrotransposon nucleocapsid protein n=1 Tax=Gigaspora margarita TaxID=4874 RepID=A0A8H4B305_GIGMA|nr:retrotransposon nucleocapsid protein [Gigaspora margarita]
MQSFREVISYDDTFKYRFECKDGILNNLYYEGEMEPLGVKEYPELDHIPSGMMCKCKGNCNTNVGCGSKCHGGNICNNKIQV